MRHAIPRFSSLAVSLGITGLFAIGYSADVRAQSIFCPTFFSGSSSSSGSPVVLLNGSCTDRVDGAFSGAAVASQALTELSQTTTATRTKEVCTAIVERREQERVRMRRPLRPARAVPSEKTKPAAVERPKPAAVTPKEPLLPLPIEPAVRFATWTQVYGDYQTRDAAGPSALTCCIGGPLPQPTLALDLHTRTRPLGLFAA